jgi:hypothetical protein
MSRQVFKGTCELNGKTMALSIDFGDPDKPVHGGTWNARGNETEVRRLRLKRRKRAAAIRLAQRQRKI